MRRRDGNHAHRRHGIGFQDSDPPAFIHDRRQSGRVHPSARANKFRDELGSEPWRIGKDGCVRPLEAPGIGVEVDEAFLKAHPAIEGPGYV